MIRGFFWDFARFWAVIALQFLFNMIHFTGFNLSPSYYILFILLLPFETPQWLVLVSSFVLGIMIDWPLDTFGQHAFASVFIAGMRPVVHQALLDRDGYETGTYPRLEYLGFRWALYYALIMTGLHSFAFYSMQTFNFSYILTILAKTILNTLVTSTLIIVSQYWFFKKVV